MTGAKLYSFISYGIVLFSSQNSTQACPQPCKARAKINQFPQPRIASSRSLPSPAGYDMASTDSGLNVPLWQLVAGGAAIFASGLALGVFALPALGAKQLSGGEGPSSAASVEQAETGAGQGEKEDAESGCESGDGESVGVSSEEDSDEEVPAGRLKQLMVVRTDLGMKKGKQCAQCCHASLGSWKVAKRGRPAWVAAWDRRGCAKIAVKCPSEELMDAVAAACAEAGLPCYIVEDAGHTQVAPGSRTVLGIGPAPEEAIDAITGPAGLYPLKLL